MKSPAGLTEDKPIAVTPTISGSSFNANSTARFRSRSVASMIIISAISFIAAATTARLKLPKLSLEYSGGLIREMRINILKRHSDHLQKSIRVLFPQNGS